MTDKLPAVEGEFLPARTWKKTPGEHEQVDREMAEINPLRGKPLYCVRGDGVIFPYTPDITKLPGMSVMYEQIPQHLLSEMARENARARIEAREEERHAQWERRARQIEAQRMRALVQTTFEAEEIPERPLELLCRVINWILSDA